MISREEAVKHLEDIRGFVFDHKWKESMDMAIEALSHERPKGRWECVRPGWYKCSCCGRELQSYSGMDTAKYYPYCHCGAKMQDVGYSETNKYHSICESLEKNGSVDMRGGEKE